VRIAVTPTSGSSRGSTTYNKPRIVSRCRSIRWTSFPVKPRMKTRLPHFRDPVFAASWAQEDGAPVVVEDGRWWRSIGGVGTFSAKDRVPRSTPIVAIG